MDNICIYTQSHRFHIDLTWWNHAFGLCVVQVQCELQQRKYGLCCVLGTNEVVVRWLKGVLGGPAASIYNEQWWTVREFNIIQHNSTKFLDPYTDVGVSHGLQTFFLNYQSSKYCSYLFLALKWSLLCWVCWRHGQVIRKKRELGSTGSIEHKIHTITHIYVYISIVLYMYSYIHNYIIIHNCIYNYIYTYNYI